MRVYDRRDRVCGVVKTVDEFEATRDEQCDAEQNDRIDMRIANDGQVAREVIASIYDAGDDNDARQDIEPRARFMSAQRRSSLRRRSRRYRVYYIDVGHGGFSIRPGEPAIIVVDCDNEMTMLG